MLQVEATGIGGGGAQNEEFLDFYTEILSKPIHSNISSHFYFVLMLSTKIRDWIPYAWGLHKVSSLNYQKIL
jgi:hypothetical protein